MRWTNLTGVVHSTQGVVFGSNAFQLQTFVGLVSGRRKKLTPHWWRETALEPEPGFPKRAAEDDGDRVAVEPTWFLFFMRHP